MLKVLVEIDGNRAVRDNLKDRAFIFITHCSHVPGKISRQLQARTECLVQVKEFP